APLVQTRHRDWRAVPHRTQRGQGNPRASPAADDRSTGRASAEESADGTRSLARPDDSPQSPQAPRSSLLPQAEPCREGSFPSTRLPFGPCMGPWQDPAGTVAARRVYRMLVVCLKTLRLAELFAEALRALLGLARHVEVRRVLQRPDLDLRLLA